MKSLTRMVNTSSSRLANSFVFCIFIGFTYPHRIHRYLFIGLIRYMRRVRSKCTCSPSAYSLTEHYEVVINNLFIFNKLNFFKEKQIYFYTIYFDFFTYLVNLLSLGTYIIIYLTHWFINIAYLTLVYLTQKKILNKPYLLKIYRKK